MELFSPERPSAAQGKIYYLVVNGEKAGAVPQFWLAFEPEGKIAMGVWLLAAPADAHHHSRIFENLAEVQTFQRDFQANPEAALHKWFGWSYDSTAKKEIPHTVKQPANLPSDISSIIDLI